MAFPSPDRDHFQLGTLSHVLNMRATGYQELPEWPEVAPDPTVRNVELPPVWTEKPSKHTGTKKKQDLKSFYSESESSEEGVWLGKEEEMCVCVCLEGEGVGEEKEQAQHRKEAGPHVLLL